MCYLLNKIKVFDGKISSINPFKFQILCPKSWSSFFQICPYTKYVGCFPLYQIHLFIFLSFFCLQQDQNCFMIKMTFELEFLNKKSFVISLGEGKWKRLLCIVQDKMMLADRTMGSFSQKICYHGTYKQRNPQNEKPRIIIMNKGNISFGL